MLKLWLSISLSSSSLIFLHGFIVKSFFSLNIRLLYKIRPDMAMENAPMKNWELTLYELQRKPQEPITDGTKIAVSPRSLQSELMCPICLDILKVTMTTKECLHRFCSDCIVTALRNGNKECPTCRKKLVSKRSLRRDPNFDALIAKIYPDREVSVVCASFHFVR